MVPRPGPCTAPERVELLFQVVDAERFQALVRGPARHPDLHTSILERVRKLTDERDGLRSPCSEEAWLVVIAHAPGGRTPSSGDGRS